MDSKILTIGIPTFNRPDQLSRLVDQISTELMRDNLQNDVEILICDNSLNNQSELFVETPVNIVYIHNSLNIGFDANIAKLCKTAEACYIWLFSDDDLILPGSILFIVDYLKQGNPDVILAPFRQPEDLTILPYQSSPSFRSATNLEECVRYILNTGKITSYILNLKKIRVSVNDLTTFKGTGWMHQAIALECINASKSKELVTMNRFCAYSKRDEFKNLEWTPLAFSKGEILLGHPIFEYSTTLLYSVKTDYLKSLARCELIYLIRGLSKSWPVKSFSDYKHYASRLAIKPIYKEDTALFVMYLLIKSKVVFFLKPFLLVHDVVKNLLSTHRSRKNGLG